MKTLLVIFGSKSSEYEVSLSSAYSFIKNVPADEYNILLLGITKEGQWLLYEGDIEDIPSGEWIKGGCTPAVISPNFGEKSILVFREGGIERLNIDVCFPILHGKNGEDGTIQGLLEISGIPYVGSGVLASAMCMDKAVTNMTADFCGVPQAKWLSTEKAEYEKDENAFLEKCVDYLGLPIFVKPANAGSSVGISKAKTYEELKSAAERAFKEDSKIVAEEAIDGRELECSVLGNRELILSVPGEIVSCHEFYDYEAKYISESQLLIPARISPEEAKRVQEISEKMYRALGCKGLSRVDFFRRSSDGEILFSEINTLPGFTSISMFSKLLEATGVTYSEIINRLIKLALES